MDKKHPDPDSTPLPMKDPSPSAPSEKIPEIKDPPVIPEKA